MLALVAVTGWVGSAGAKAPPLAPGLSRSEHAALVKVGAFGRHPIKVLLLGDSIALTLGVGLELQSESGYGVEIFNHSTLGCDLDPTLAIITSGKIGLATPGCPEWRGLWPFLTAYVHPAVVVLGVGRWETGYHFFEGHWVNISSPVWADHVASDLRDAVRIFTTFGARVALLNMPYIDPPDRQANGLPFPENTAGFSNDYNAVAARVAAADPSQVSVIPFNRMLDPDGHYTSEVDGVDTRWSDGIHVSTAGGKFLQRDILPLIDRIALRHQHAARGRR
jgi:hypothetical protein